MEHYSGKKMIEPEVLASSLAEHLVPVGSNYILNSGWTDAGALQRLEERLGSVHNSLSSLETVNEEISTGTRRNGKMSAVRRFFCLFVLFDLLLTSLTWLLCIMLIGGDNLIDVLKKQIVYCNITTSLFDIVLAAFCRFTVLLLFYGLLELNTTFFVAFTTLGTCVFLICKVIYYSWSTASQPAFQVILVLISFIIAWAEAWFLDFRVLPQELTALNYVQSKNRISEVLNTLLLERDLGAPVFRNFFRDMGSEIGGPAESNGNFYSPLESPNDSGDESDEKRTDLERRKHQYFPVNEEPEAQSGHGPFAPKLERGQFLSRRKTQLEGKESDRKSEYLRWGEDTLDVAWSILHDHDWTLQEKSAEGDLVFSKHEARLGKLFLLRGKINIQAQTLLEELFDNVERFTQWNKALLESKRVQVIDDRTDITYQVSAPSGNGSISSRDFVNLRHWDVKGDAFVLAGISIPYPSLPPSKNYVRGENGPCCWVIRPLKEDDERCLFEFLLNTNLKGWIPAWVVETALTSVLLEYITSLREHCKTIANRMAT